MTRVARVRGFDGANPLVSFSDSPRWREAFARLDLKIVIDPAMTETARLADMRQRYGAWEADKIAPKWAARSSSFEFDGRTFKFTP